MIDAILGSIIGVLEWLGGLLFKSHTAAQAQAREHDKTLFRKGDATVNEAFLDTLLNGNLYHLWCWVADIRPVRHFCQDSVREENQFLDRKVKRKALKAIQRLAAVDSFVATHFFTANNNAEMLRLYPEWRDSADEERRTQYWNYAKELNALTERAWEAYRTYRATVRDRLMV